MPRRWLLPRDPDPGFVRPKIGDVVWYYIEHAFWDVPQDDLVGYYGEVIKQWRFTGRTELRARAARVTVLEPDWHQLQVKPEYDSDDRVIRHTTFGTFAHLAPRETSTYIHRSSDRAGRIVDGVLPCPGTWGFDPLPMIGGGR